MTLPSVRDISLAGEANAYHEEFFGRLPGAIRFPPGAICKTAPIAKPPSMSAPAGSSSLLRRTIDDSFKDFDLVVLPTRRRMPRKIDAAIKRERTR